MAKTTIKKTRRPAKKNKPKFSVPNLGFFKSVKARWRKPRGTANKKRMKYRFMGCLPKIGYRNKKSVRGLHARGLPEVLVCNMAELEAQKDKAVLVRLSATLGGRKRKLLEEKAKSLKLEILNMPFDGKAPAWKGGKSAQN
ncbi:MAG: eL32 family ribosomal protein [Candidatus Micrarchaeota archaeon]